MRVWWALDISYQYSPCTDTSTVTLTTPGGAEYFETYDVEPNNGQVNLEYIQAMSPCDAGEVQVRVDVMGGDGIADDKGIGDITTTVVAPGIAS